MIVHRRAVLAGIGAASLAAGSAANAEPMDDLNAQMNDWTWVSRSRETPDLAPRFCFTLRETVYVGDPNDADAVLSEKNEKPVRLPRFPRARKAYASAAEVSGHEAEMADYYRTVLTMTGRSAEEMDYVLWLRLDLYSPATKTDIPFFIWNRLSELTPFSDWVRSGDEGSRFQDLDQGWEVKGQHLGDHVHLQHTGFDQGGEFANVRVEQATLARRITAEENQLKPVIARLRDLAGFDVWS